MVSELDSLIVKVLTVLVFSMLLINHLYVYGVVPRTDGAENWYIVLEVIVLSYYLACELNWF